MCDKIFILGGGPSLTSFDFNKLLKERTIAVNAAIFNLPTATFFVTIDQSFFKKVGSPNISDITATKVFVANFSSQVLVEHNGQIKDIRYNRVYNLEQYDMILKSYNSNGLGFTFKDFRCGNNSGYCALQLAVLLRYKIIYLLGIDLCTTQNSHYHKIYKWGDYHLKKNMPNYEMCFREGIAALKSTDVKVYSCSPISKLNDIIQYVPIEDVLC